MGWFWEVGRSKSDPTTYLDPDLKEFLKSQQPAPYIPVEKPKTSETPSNSQPAFPDTNKTFEDRPLPRESLFQDGRYKHIWKTYIPQDEIAVVATSPVERLVTARKERRELIHRAALENCAFEHEIQQDCMVFGTSPSQLRSRMTMCRKETKAFNRCYQLQAKFMQALGYMTSANYSDEDEEKIQMHADKLYHRMMDYEASVEEAKSKGTPIPPLASVFNPSQQAPSIEQLSLPANMEAKLKKPLHEMPPHERELAVRAVLSEAKMTHLYSEEFNHYAVEMNEQRKSRQDWLVKAFGEPIGKFLVPDPPKDPNFTPYSMDDLNRKQWEDDLPRQTPVDSPDITPTDCSR